MSHKIGICIPYRNRKEHIDKLIPHLSKHLTNQGIDHGFYVGHQVDEKLFNRGTMKNIAAKYAFEDGCDYVAFHDVDMLPDVNADYSYPEEHPIHIATKLSKYNYGMGYEQYFGGVVLITKEQVYDTNGYSNNYWDWGQEDDDLFWRCHFENHTLNNIFKSYKNKVVANFNGDDSYISIPTDRNISSCLNNDFTISVLFCAEQQVEKTPIWLVGDEERKFIEYPILRKRGSFTWGLSFNNSRSVNMVVIDRNSNHYYNYGKRNEKEWTWVTMSFDPETKEMYFYVNDKLVTNINDVVYDKPFIVNNKLKLQDSIKPFLLGFCEHTKTHYKGKISEIKIYDKFIGTINDMIDSNDNLQLHVDFSNEITNKINDNICGINNIEFTNEDINVINSFLPFRREGSFECMPHIDEGYVDGKWAKGETTAKNEKRFVTEMQQGLIDYKKDGINNLQFELVNVEKNSYNCSIINVKL
jgi:hypothetical protein